MTSHEFQPYERINELLKQIGVQNTRDLGPILAEYLESSKTPFNASSVPIAQSIAKIINNNPSQSNEFKQRYADLKERHCRDLDTFVYFLAEICDKPDIKQMLSPKSLNNLSTIITDNTFNAGLSSTLGANSSKLSSTALAEMKEKVLKPSSSSNIITSNLMHSLSRFNLDKSSATTIRTKREITNCPDYPSWVHDRLHLSWDFYPNPEKLEPDVDASKMSISVQEEQLVDDLLNCMIGIEGTFIKTPTLLDKHSERTFHVDRSLDPAMRELTKRIIPVCSNYSLIRRFVEEKSEFKWGLVNQALCSAIRELLKNHYVFVCQLENLQRKGSLSLQKLWYYVSPIMAFMDILASIIKTINKSDFCGSAVINILCDKINFYSGDPKIQELIVYLAQTASRPYLSILEDWIYRGQLNDPYNEFMIGENKDKPRNDKKDEECLNEKFWWKKYFIIKENVPKFLDPLQNKIHLTGKYLNAIHETGTFLIPKEDNSSDNEELSLVEVTERDEKSKERPFRFKQPVKAKKLVIPNAVEINFSTKEDYYKSIVDNAYNYSSEVLLNLLLKEHKLMDRLRSLKHYFLLDQSDFMVHFMDIAEDEIQKNYKDIRINKLESLLEISLRITSANSDPFKDDLRVKLFNTDLKTMLIRIQSIDANNDTARTDQGKDKLDRLSGLAVFSLDYVIKWPISLIVNKRTMLDYQLLFRHIFLIKHVERNLCNVWLCTKSGELCLGRSNRFYALSCALKQRMLNFVQNLLNYMTFEVIESHWNTFEEQMSQVTNVDNVIEHHKKFLDSCMRDCMINSEHFLDIHKILSVCSSFSDYVQSVTLNTRIKEESVKQMGFRSAQEKKMHLQENAEELNKIVKAENFIKAIMEHDKQFSQLLLHLLDKIMHQMSNSLGETKIANVLYRLDFNDHYRDQLDRLRQEAQSTNQHEDNDVEME